MKKTPTERLYEKTRRDQSTGCLEFQGYRIKKGYGYIGTENGKTTTTHRLAWQIAHGPIPEGMFVLHKCDNPPCCNPDHLFLGTNKDNMDDRSNKQRQARGSRMGSSKLVESDIPVIRKRLSAGETHRSIAKSYGVSSPIITYINTGRTWKHIQ